MSALTLFILRHAKALAADAHGGDFPRPLAPRGLSDAAQIGRWLHAHYPAIDLAVVSPAQRTRETLDRLLAAWPAAAPLTIWEPALYLAELPTLLHVLATQSARRVLVLGHNPGMEALLCHCLGNSCAGLDPTSTLMPTAALYVLEIAERGSLAAAGTATLLDHMRPALLADAD